MYDAPVKTNLITTRPGRPLLSISSAMVTVSPNRW
jgi:hypothetical protein